MNLGVGYGSVSTTSAKHYYYYLFELATWKPPGLMAAILLDLTKGIFQGVSIYFVKLNSA